jgi:cysteine desulfurase/selenocysteine lyase
MSREWVEIRRDFPALARSVYLNTAAAGPIPRPVREAVDRFYRELEDDGDACWEAWLERQEDVRRDVAAFVGAQPDEIAFVINTSTGMNLIADLLAEDGPVLTDTLEFPTVTLPWIHRGTELHFVEPGADGALQASAFAADEARRSATLLVSHVQYSNGCRQDLPSFAAAKSGRHFVVCGSQALGALSLDVVRDGVDALACAGHKWLCAGYGAGFVYLSRALVERRPRTLGWLSVEEPFAFDNRRYRLLPAARRVELGCPHFGGVFALGAAVRFLAAIGRERIEARVLELNTMLTDGLAHAGFRVLSPGGAHRSGQTLVALNDPARATAFLCERRVLVTEKAQGVRVSTHFFNDEADVEAGIAALVACRRLLG